MEQRNTSERIQRPSRSISYRLLKKRTPNNQPDYSWETLNPERQREILLLVATNTRQRRNRRVRILVSLLIVLLALGIWYFVDSNRWFWS